MNYARFYIDGYNLLFRLLKNDEHLKHERDQLIQELEVKINLLELDVTLVFDSQYQPDEGSISYIKRLEVVFTALGETADDYILKRIKEAPFPECILVVTSDKRLAALCRRRLAKVEGVAEFNSMLNRRYKNKLAYKKSRLQRKQGIHRPIKKAIAKSDLPFKESLPEGCQEKYLAIFEKRFQDSLPPPEPFLPSKKTGKKEWPISLEEQQLPNRERWQRAFERTLEDGEAN